jgi:ATP-dependent RNA helicase DDX54/DBP10
MEPSSGKAKAGSFSAMGLEKDLFKGLHRMGYMNPTPVQRKALPIVLAGVDVVCMARTGSGKTCVFLLPLIQKLKAHDSNSGVRAVVLSPTRELALQTFKFAKDMAKFTDLRIVSIVGGDPIEQQFEALASRPDVIVATPGRLMHHIREIPTFNLKYVRYLCFDEADRLFEMGFAEQLNEIVRECPVERQTLLFSATMPKQLIQFSRAGLREPQLVRLDTDIKLSEELRVAYFATRSNEKVAALLYLVRTVIPEGQLTIIFTATKHHSEFIHYLFEKIGASSALVYGSMDQDARNENLRRFRKGEVQYLIVTDVAARGIDVPLLNNVINFHFTPMPKLFIHRCGRAARQGRIGFAMSLVDPEELAYMGDVHKFLGHDVCVGVPPTSTSSLAGIEENEISHNSKLYTTYTGESYDTKTMTPKLVHTGLLPQDVLDEENEFFKSSLEKDDTLSNMWRVCENAMKQYRRTRPEASHEGVKIAKALTKGKAIRMIHPLIAGVDPKRCDSAVVEKANFVRVLQTFRPAQTVFETGIGTGSTSQAVKKKGKQGSKESKGVEIMKALRRTTVSSLERNRADKKNGKLGDIHDDDDDDDDDDNEDDDGDEPAAFSSTYDDCDEDGDDALDGGCDEYPDNDVYDGDEPNQDDGPSNDHVYENDCDEDPNTTHSSKKQTFRLSAAEKKRLKKKGMSSQEIADYASQKAVAASYIVTDAGTG